MTENKLHIQISRPVSEVFDFTLNPANTPKWIPFCDHEETSEWPARKGTWYTNYGKNGTSFKFRIVDIDQNKSFELIGEDNNYKCRYTFTDLGDKTEFEYFEWMEHGELEAPFTQDILENLKSVMEH